MIIQNLVMFLNLKLLVILKYHFHFPHKLYFNYIQKSLNYHLMLIIFQNLFLLYFLQILLLIKQTK